MAPSNHTVPTLGTVPGDAPTDGVDLYWIPLGAGAGGSLVRWCGRLYEALAAAAGRRPRCDLYHSALEVHLDGVTTTIEMAPVWVTQGERGVVVEGPVGLRLLGRVRMFRYEVRCWRDGSIPDVAAAAGPVQVTDEPRLARRVVELVPDFPAVTWGRDELGAGEMWNSNSLASWLLAGAGIDLTSISPPGRGRAPGWAAGLAVAARSR
jgi:hypothetical protein